MAIVETRAVNYGTMQGYLLGDPTNSIIAASSRFDKVWVISITNVSKDDYYKTPILVTDTEDKIALQFDDVEDHYDSYSGITKPREDKYTYFDEAMATKICKFIWKADKSNPTSRDLLVVNCHMGVSRSGAVSDFVRSVFNLDYDNWKQMNSMANPNLLVKCLLHYCWDAWEIEELLRLS